MGAYKKAYTDSCRPTQRLSHIKWGNTHRVLPKTSPEPGPYRSERTPWVEIILGWLEPTSPYEIVWIMKGSQIGVTEGANTWLGSTIDQDPGPFLYIMPTDKTLKKNSKRRVDPLIELSPPLAKKVKVKKSRDAGNTTFYKEYPGGELILTSARSTSNLKSDAIRYVLADEVDDYVQNANHEGDIIELIKVRTRTFGSRKKVLIISSPGIKGASIIEPGFEQTNMHYLYVPCPECQTMQTIKWERIKWEWGKPETVHMECANKDCDYKIKNEDKTYMFDHIEARPTSESLNPKEVGLHVSALYSPVGWYSWQDAAVEWQKCYRNKKGSQPDLLKLQTFINTILGETFENKGDAPEYVRLFERKEEYPVNELKKDVLILTAGIDVQKDRAEMEIVGWGKDLESWSIDYRVINGDPKQKKLWQNLKGMILHDTFENRGLQLPISMAAIDTGSHGWTNNVYVFAREMWPRVMAIKGSGINHPMNTPSYPEIDINGNKIPEGCELYEIGVSFFKKMLYGQLKLSINEDGTYPAGYCHYPNAYDIDYFRGLTSESLREAQDSYGQKKYVFYKQPGVANEPLDCRVYAMAAAAKLQLLQFSTEDWLILEKELYGPKSDGDDSGRMVGKF